MSTVFLLFLAGVLGGALNSVAGGGSFIVFPALMLTGISPIAANATTTVGLWPASLASAVAYRRDLPPDRKLVYTLTVVSLIGGGLGGLILLKTTDATFVKQIPFLIGFAALLLTLGPQIQDALAKVVGSGSRSLVLGSIVQLAIAIYGGYFGAGMGILMLATFAVMGMTNIHSMNGLKNVLGTALNGVASVLFISAGQTRFEPAIAIIIGGTIGGYAGAAIARTVAPNLMRIIIIAIAWAMTAYFTVRAFAT